MPFHALGIGPPLTDTLRRLGFEVPTPIQEKAIPAILEGRDVVGAAQTGSGKTAAFLLPSLHRLMQKPSDGSTRLLVLVPTRELATQVHTVATELAEGSGIRSMPVYGGVAMEGQAAALRTGTDVIIATPGRLLDHAGRGTTRFKGLEVLVMDEADRMLDMGFLPDIRRILAVLPRDRQNLLFSATMPPDVAELVKDLLKDPVRVQVGPVRTTAVPIGITHAIFPVPERRKTALLEVLLRRGGMSSVLVFTRTKVRADRLCRDLDRLRFPVGIIHGDREQKERERELAAFMDGYVHILVATDIAARGLDVEGITHVVNYDFPRTPDDYLHRVGRTGRADAKGDAFTLLSPEEEREVAAVERKMGASIPRVTLPEFDYSGDGGGSREGPVRGRRGSGGGGSRHGPSRGSRDGSHGSPRGGSRGGSSGGGRGRRSGSVSRSTGRSSGMPSAPKPAESFGPPPEGGTAPASPPAKSPPPSGGGSGGRSRGRRPRGRGGRGRK